MSRAAHHVVLLLAGAMLWAAFLPGAQGFHCSPAFTLPSMEEIGEATVEGLGASGTFHSPFSPPAADPAIASPVRPRFQHYFRRGHLLNMPPSAVLCGFSFAAALGLLFLHRAKVRSRR